MDELRNGSNGHGVASTESRAGSWLREAVRFIRASASPFAMWRYVRRWFERRPLAGIAAALAMITVVMMRRRARARRLPATL